MKTLDPIRDLNGSNPYQQQLNEDQQAIKPYRTDDRRPGTRKQRP